MRKAFYIILAFLIGLILRLYPTFLSGLPFSTDAWNPIRNAELLVRYTPIPMDSKVFDGYNNYWPANSIFGVIFSYIIGLRVIDAMAISIPLVGALTILIFYVLIDKISKNSKLAFFASILLATAYPYALFTAGVTKETYANTLYVLIILIFLNHKRWESIIPFIITSITLNMSHHLTTLITIGVLISIMLATEISRIRKGFDIDKFSILFVSIILTITALYFVLYAYEGLKIIITSSDILSVISYQIIAFTLTLYFVFRPSSHSKIRTILSCTLGTILVFLIILLTTQRSIIPGAPKLPNHYLLYASPFILISPLIVLGFGITSSIRDEHHIAPLFWLATLLGLEGYAVFGNTPLGLTLAYRVLDFLWLPLIIIFTFGLYRISTADSQKASKIIVFLITVIIILNSYDFYASVSLQERYLGYFWLYTQPEYNAAKWIAMLNQTIVSDVKISYLLTGYFNVHADPNQGLQYLMSDTNSVKHLTLFVYDQMLKNGYVLYGGYSVDLPKNWTEKLNSLNLIYCNNQVKIYSK